MCLLITQTKQSPILSNKWLEDFYSYNSDGVGVMTVEHGNILIKKILPKDSQEFIDFYHDNIKGKDCAFHLRMRTHGAIDLDNCHPYQVLNQSQHGLDLWLMHNGVLKSGNAQDTTKSDTWHYINDYLKPILATNPNFYLTKEFNSLIASHIGVGNKFVLMDNLGHQVIINQHSGVYWGGLWLSNTYAWSSPLTVSLKPSNSKKDCISEIKQKPVKAIKTNWKSYANYNSLDYQSFDKFENDNIYDYEYWIEQSLEDFNYYGFMKAGSLDYDTIFYFLEIYSQDAFLELSEQLIDRNITEDDFLDLIHNPSKAKISYPNLKQYSLI